MKGFILLTLLSVIFVSEYAMAQGCPCDIAELPDETTGNDIVELVCPGGELAEGAVFTLLINSVAVSLESTGYSVNSTLENCTISNPLVATGRDLSPQETLSCRNSLIERCGLNIRPIPTLSEWGLIAMAGILGIAGLMVLRRRKSPAV